MSKTSASMRILAAAALAAGLGTAWADSAHRMIASGELAWSDLASLPPGAKVSVLEGKTSEAVPITVRIKFPANYTLPAHILRTSSASRR